MGQSNMAGWGDYSSLDPAWAKSEEDGLRLGFVLRETALTRVLLYSVGCASLLVRLSAPHSGCSTTLGLVLVTGTLGGLVMQLVWFRKVLQLALNSSKPHRHRKSA